jgi:P27 family predicted phage terminase small subunit
MPGSPRKPNELKRAQGNPGGRKLPELAKVVSLPQVSIAPAHLSPTMKDLWDDIRDRATWVAETDSPTLLLLCEKFDRRAELLAKLDASDPVLFTDKGYAYANPLVGMISTIETEIFKILGSLGLTPSDRSRLGIAEVKKQSALDELIAKRKSAK